MESYFNFRLTMELGMMLLTLVEEIAQCFTE